jgi:hypothetical protein
VSNNVDDAKYLAKADFKWVRIQMRFSHKDKKDKRVIKHSTYPLDYPANVDEAPEQPGVYIFIDANDDFVYVGAASVEGLQDTIKADSNMASKVAAIKYRWFVTENLDIANDLKADWSKKYS